MFNLISFKLAFDLIPFHRKLSLKHSWIRNKTLIWTNKQLQDSLDFSLRLKMLFSVQDLMCPGKEWKLVQDEQRKLHYVMICISGRSSRLIVNASGSPSTGQKKVSYHRWGRQNNITKSSSKCPGAWIDFQVLHDVQWHLYGRQRSHWLTSLVQALNRQLYSIILT